MEEAKQKKAQFSKRRQMTFAVQPKKRTIDLSSDGHSPIIEKNYARTPITRIKNSLGSPKLRRAIRGMTAD
jgi:hypothetical protein